jgi:hypothetical protein
MRLRTAFVLGLILMTSIVFASSFYQLSWVKRVDKDLYSAKSGSAKLLIETKYCYEITAGEDATLKYDRYAYDNKIIFQSETSCDVVKVVSQ